MKNLVVIFSALASLALFTGCKDIDVQNGRIPDGYEQAAQVLAGTYSGYLAKSVSQAETQKVPSTLTVNIVEGRPVLTTSADFMGEGCGSSIGQLERVTAEDSGKLRQVVFSFNGGRCAADNRIVLNVFQRTSDGRVEIYGWVVLAVSSNSGDTQRSGTTETDRIGRFIAQQPPLLSR